MLQARWLSSMIGSRRASIRRLHHDTIYHLCLVANFIAGDVYAHFRTRKQVPTALHAWSGLKGKHGVSPSRSRHCIRGVYAYNPLV